MGRPKGKKSTTLHIWSDEEKAYLKEITPGRHYKEIHELMNKKFEYEFTLRQVTTAIKRYGLKTGFTGQFPKGNIPVNKGMKGLTGANKTSFKKGERPVNHKPVGSERVDADGYTLIKVAEPSTWKHKHRVIYEDKHGKIPKRSAVIFLDGNRSNFDIENLALVNRKKLLVLNKEGLIKNDAELTNAGLNVAELLIKTKEMRKKLK